MAAWVRAVRDGTHGGVAGPPWARARGWAGPAGAPGPPGAVFSPQVRPRSPGSPGPGPPLPVSGPQWTHAGDPRRAASLSPTVVSGPARWDREPGRPLGVSGLPPSAPTACRPPAGRIPLLPPEARRTVLDPWAVHRGKSRGLPGLHMGLWGELQGGPGSAGGVDGAYPGPARGAVGLPPAWFTAWAATHGPGVVWTRSRVESTSVGG